MKYTPVFEKDGNRFLIADPAYLADDEHKAWEIGIGAMLVEGILLDFKMAKGNNIMKVPDDGESTLTATPGTITNSKGEGLSVYLNPQYIPISFKANKTEGK